MIDNSDRACTAEAAVKAFQADCSTDDEDAIADLIGNLCHLAAMRGDDPLAEVRRGLSHYYAETHHEKMAFVVVRFDEEGDRKLDVAEVAGALRAVVVEVEGAKGLMVSANGVLDPLHPVCIQAKNGRAVLNFIADEGARTGAFPIKK